MKQRAIRSVKDLGTAIRDSRVEQGLTQAELARVAGVSREWIVGVEQGNRPRAELSRLLTVLRALGEPLSVGDTPAADRTDPRHPAPAARERAPITDATQSAIDRVRSSALKGIDPDVLKRATDSLGDSMRPDLSAVQRALRSTQTPPPNSEDQQ